MVKNVLGGLAAVALTAVLIVLITQSRSVDEAYYAAHVTRLNQIELAAMDVESIYQGLRSAHDDARSVPDTVDAAFTRLQTVSASLVASIDPAFHGDFVSTAMNNYVTAVDSFVNQSDAAAKHQTQLARSLSQLQSDSPAKVRELRSFNLDLQAQNVFSVTLDVFDFASGKVTSGTANLRSRLDALTNDRTIAVQAPGRLDKLIYLAEDVLRQHELTANSLEAIDRVALQLATQQLTNTLASVNRDRVNQAERAGFMLSVFSVLLLAGVGVIAWRLHQSYSALNESNRTLEDVNETLEARVVERTVELSSAYDELKESQVQLVQAEKMSSLGSLVAGISHEINTPLWYLISNSTVIQERLATVRELSNTASTMVSAVARRDNVPEALNTGIKAMNRLIKDGIEEDIEEAGDLIEDSIQGLNDLTEMAQSLKDFSRLDRAPVGEFDVNEGIDKTLKIVNNKIKERITVNKEYGELSPMTCSPSQINQIFLNLISNAADAIEGEGTITITTSQSDDRTQIKIADTGCGITPEVLSKIRDPFFTTKEVGKGTGLGLSIVDKIIKSHKGELQIDSTVGEGSVFTISFPLNAAIGDAEAEEPAFDETVTLEASATHAQIAEVADDVQPALSPA